MKKIYLPLSTMFALLCLIDQGFAQGTYNAIRNGNWSNPVTWDVSGIPSASCNNCTITITAGVTVTFDVNDTLRGNTVLNIGSDATSQAKLLIPFSSNIQSASHNQLNIIYQSGVRIILANANTSLDASTTGNYDGVFYLVPFGNPVTSYVPIQVLGNATTIDWGWNPQGFPGPSNLDAYGILPIILTDFNVALNDNIANLTWATAIELNFSHFTVQRSGDGSTWEPIGTVASKNVPSGASYSFNDPSPLHGNNYYRLQYVDLDGNSKFSYIKFVRGSLIHGLRFGPNPASDHVGITFGSDISSSVLVRLVNQYGAILQEKQISNAAGSTVLFKVNNYPAGIYTLQVKAAEGNQSAFRVLVSH